MQTSTSPHRPPHIYADDTWYIITASTVNRAHYLSTDEHLSLWAESLHNLVPEFSLTLRAWVVLPNHYHVLVKPCRGRDIARFISRLNGRTSRQLNLLDRAQGRQVWYSYWDTCIRSERDYWTRFNYIHQNPIKHGYARELTDWEFSSYHYYLRTKGPEWLSDCWQRYPVIDHLQFDDF